MKMSAHIRNGFRATFSGVRSAGVFLLTPISFREILLFSGCGLIWLGLSAVYPPAAVIVPGAILTGVAVFGVR